MLHNEPSRRRQRKLLMLMDNIMGALFCSWWGQHQERANIKDIIETAETMARQLCA
jgi:hypothetical protein